MLIIQYWQSERIINQIYGQKARESQCIWQYHPWRQLKIVLERVKIRNKKIKKRRK